MTKDTNEEDDKGIMEEYENQFKEIDSELDALRSSLHEDKGPQPPTQVVGGRGTTVIPDEVTEDADDTVDYDFDDLSTVDESLSLHVGKLQAALAQESAQEMERIVQTLRAQQEEGNGPKHDESSQLTLENRSNNSNPTSNRSSTPRWMIFLVSILTLVCAGLAWHMWSSSTSPVVVMYTPAETTTTVHVKQTYTRQVCRMDPRTGQQFCESDQTSQHQASSSSAAAPGGGGGVERQVYYHQRQQQCQYVNGQSYCESYEESRSAPATATSPVGDRTKALPSP